MKLIRLTAAEMLSKLPRARWRSLQGLVDHHPHASDVILWRTPEREADIHLTGQLVNGDTTYPPVDPATNEWLTPLDPENHTPTHWTPVSELRAFLAATATDEQNSPLPRAPEIRTDPDLKNPPPPPHPPHLHHEYFSLFPECPRRFHLSALKPPCEVKQGSNKERNDPSAAQKPTKQGLTPSPGASISTSSTTEPSTEPST